MTRQIASMTPLIFPGPELIPRSVQPSLLDLPNVALVSQGRAAIVLALRAHGVNSGHNVLLPAFHCPAMTAAIRAVGAVPRFFRIQEDFRVCAADVTAASDNCTQAVVIPHLFVRRQAKSLFQYLQDNSRWLLIEDCAHSFFGNHSDEPMGSFGHVAIGSVAKFFPGKWGGILGNNLSAIGIKTVSPPLRFEMKLLVNAAEEAASFGRMGSWSGAARNVLASLSRHPSHVLRKASADVSAGASDVISVAAPEPVDMSRLGQNAGRWMGRQLRDSCRFQSRAVRRYEVFRQLRDSLMGMRNGSPMAGCAEADFPPYVFPLLLRDPKRHFPALRNQGVPMYRWEHSVETVCSVTDHYRHSVIQLPCHDAMTQSELRKIIESVRTILE